jgi:hypothetical protein
VVVAAPTVQREDPGTPGPVPRAPQAPTGESAERHEFRATDYSPADRAPWYPAKLG